jgi:DNA-directed RNA polymerase specialized sigma24 family protein
MRPTGAKGQYRVSSESLARQLSIKGTGKLVTGQQWSGQRFETIFLHQYGRVYRLLVQILGSAAAAEDAAQEVFLRLYRQEHLPADEVGLQRWLAKVAVNHALNLLRTDKRQQQRWQQQALLQQHEIAGRARAQPGTTDLTVSWFRLRRNRHRPGDCPWLSGDAPSTG